MCRRQSRRSPFWGLNRKCRCRRDRSSSCFSAALASLRRMQCLVGNVNEGAGRMKSTRAGKGKAARGENTYKSFLKIEGGFGCDIAYRNQEHAWDTVADIIRGAAAEADGMKGWESCARILARRFRDQCTGSRPRGGSRRSREVGKRHLEYLDLEGEKQIGLRDRRG
jgi:hypothetical protein